MTEIPPGGPGYEAQRRKSRYEQVREEIEANRRGEYVVPTWVLLVVLIVMVAGIAALVLYANLT